MGNIGGGEILVILLVALLVLGPDKLPEVARQVGKAMGEMRKISAGFQREIQDAIRVADDPKPAVTAPPAEATDTFLTTEPAALTDDAPLSDDAELAQSVEVPATNEAREPADAAATTGRIAMTEPAGLTTEPAGLTTDIVTPPEAPPLPSDAALGGDR